MLFSLRPAGKGTREGGKLLIFLVVLRTSVQMVVAPPVRQEDRTLNFLNLVIIQEVMFKDVKFSFSETEVECRMPYSVRPAYNLGFICCGNIAESCCCIRSGPVAVRTF